MSSYKLLCTSSSVFVPAQIRFQCYWLLFAFSMQCCTTVSRFGSVSSGNGACKTTFGARVCVASRPALLHCFWRLLLLHQIWPGALEVAALWGCWRREILFVPFGGGWSRPEGGGSASRAGARDAGALALLRGACAPTEVCSAPGRGAVNPHHGPSGFRGESESARGCVQWEAVPVRDRWLLGVTPGSPDQTFSQWK